MNWCWITDESVDGGLKKIHGWAQSPQDPRQVFFANVSEHVRFQMKAFGGIDMESLDNLIKVKSKEDKKKNSEKIVGATLNACLMCCETECVERYLDVVREKEEKLRKETKNPLLELELEKNNMTNLDMKSLRATVSKAIGDDNQLYPVALDFHIWMHGELCPVYDKCSNNVLKRLFGTEGEFFECI
eukprot:SAG31_NODE_8724_length_1399_cov_1.366154_3_plen_186_part_01